MSNLIVVLKLTTGEEVIGIELNNGPQVIQMEKLRLFTLAHGPQGQMVKQLMPWLLSSLDATVEINLNSVIARIHESKLPVDLVTSYRNMTSSIQIASPSTSAHSIIKAP